MAAKIQENLKYTKDHEWALVEGKTLTFGLTDFAQSSLGDIVFLELPDVESAGQSTRVEKGAACGVVESIKSVSDIFSPASGTVIASNKEIEATPERCNTDPYGTWLIKIQMTNPSEVNELMSANEYKEYCASL